MGKTKTRFKVKGLDRKENIHSSLSIYDSIKIIFNSMICNKGNMLSISLVVDENKIEIKGAGKNCTSIYECTDNEDLHGNLLLQSLIYLGSEVKVGAYSDGELRKKVLSFKDINDSYGDILPDNSEDYKDIEEEDEAIKFIIEKSKVLIKGQALYDDVMKKKIINNIKLFYREAVLNGLKIKMFGEEIEGMQLDGNIVNKNDYIINKDNSTRVYLYKMNKDKNGFEVIINDVSIDIPFLKDYMNWKRSPLKRDGYTYTQLYISLRLVREHFNLNDKERIKKIIEILTKDIEGIIENNSDEFLNSEVNISVKYDRKKMDAIKKAINKAHASVATVQLLDDYWESIKENKE